MTKRLFAVGSVAAVALAVLVGGRLAGAKEVAAKNGPKERCAALVAKLKADDVDGLIALCDAEYPPDVPKPPDRFATLKLHRQQAAQVNGKPLGEVELVRSEAIGTTYARHTYLERYERHAWMWQFTFTRTADGWHLTDMTWTSELHKIHALFAVTP
jgi:hypothetical protein